MPFAFWPDPGMRLTETHIEISRIRQSDRSFQITTAPVTKTLTTSVRQMGVLNPPVLQETESGFKIISGFRRIEACRNAGIESIPVRIAGQDAAPMDCIKWAIAENAFQRNLNLIEQSRAFSLIGPYCDNLKALSAMAVELGLPDNIGMIQKLGRVAGLPSMIQDMILSETIPLSMALELEQMDPLQGQRLAGLFNDLKLGLNRQRELLVFFQEIGAREKISTADILNEPRVMEILNDDLSDRVQKAHHLREYLRRRRYSEITRAETRFSEQVARLNLDSGIDLMPPANFEGMDYRLMIRFSRIDQLQAQLKHLCQIADHDAMKLILNRS